MFLLAFNLLLKLDEALNHPHSYCIKIPIKDSESFPPVGSYVYVKWTEAGEEPAQGIYLPVFSEQFLQNCL